MTAHNRPMAEIKEELLQAVSLALCQPEDTSPQKVVFTGEGYRYAVARDRLLWFRRKLKALPSGGVGKPRLLTHKQLLAKYNTPFKKAEAARRVARDNY